MSAPTEPVQSSEVPREAIASTVRCVEQDFRRLVETLGRALDVIGMADEEVIRQLRETKDAAERGLSVSETLKDLLTPSPD
jgi:hypothetical protein